MARFVRRYAAAAALAAVGAGGLGAQGTATPGTTQQAAPDRTPGHGLLAGDIVAADDGRPLAYAAVLVEPGHRGQFADAGGAFYFPQLQPGPYRLRVRQIGFAPVDTIVAVDGSGPGERLRIALRPVPFRLPRVVVLGQRPTECVATGVPDSTVDPALAQLFGEIEKNVERYRLLINEYPFDFAREEWRVVRNDAGYEETVRLDTVRYQSRAMQGRPYKPGAVVTWQIGARGDAEQLMYLPSFRDLGDSTFQRAHCFEYVGVDTAAGVPTIRIDFRPAVRLRQPDVEGSVYLDESRYIVRRAEFRLTRPNRTDPPVIAFSVTTTFREIVPLVPLFDEVRYVKPTFRTGQAATIEIDRLLSYRFEHGAPGARPAAAQVGAGP